MCFGKWLKQKTEKKDPFAYDTNIVIPPKEPISGTFMCPACGASSTIVKEINPSLNCRYCDTVLPDLKELVEMRDNRYHNLMSQEIDYKMRLKEVEEKRKIRIKELEAEKEMETMRIQQENERMRREEELEQERFMREEQRKAREHQRSINLIETIIGAIVLLALLVRFLSRH